MIYFFIHIFEKERIVGMAKNIEPILKKINSYLKLEEGTIFKIPEYQRPYSWKIDNCDKLWQDIWNFIDNGSKDRYFFGTIIINCQAKDTVFELIDGQQRTTTFLLLLKALLIRIDKYLYDAKYDSDSEDIFDCLKTYRRQIINILYRVNPENISENFYNDGAKEKTKAKEKELYLKNSLMENCSINENYKNELNTILSSWDFEEAEKAVTKIPNKQKDNKYTNFFRNFKFFYKEKIENLPQSNLNVFAKTLLDKCEVIEIKSWYVEQAITMFNSLNSDGLPLCDADIISAKLYSAAEKKNLKDDFNKLWENLKETVDKLEKNGVVSIDDILMQQMYYYRAKDTENLTDTGSVNVTTPGLRRYFTEINKSLLDDPIDFCNKMVNLAKIWEKVSDYPIIKLLLKFNSNIKLFLASYFNRFESDKITKEDVRKMAECLIKLFAILEVVDEGYSSSKFKVFLFREIVDIADSNVTVDKIKADFDKHISDNWKADDKKADDTKADDTKADNKKVNDIKEYIMEYDKNVLVYLNEYLFALEKGEELSFDTQYDIEHIMSQSGRNKDTIREDAGIKTVEEFNTVVNKLGNKILLDSEINRAIGNEWFRTKVSNEKGYKKSHYPIAKALAEKYKDVDNPSWHKDDIETATKKASGRIIKFIFGD